MNQVPGSHYCLHLALWQGEHWGLDWFCFAMAGPCSFLIMDTAVSGQKGQVLKGNEVSFTNGWIFLGCNIFRNVCFGASVELKQHAVTQLRCALSLCEALFKNVEWAFWVFVSGCVLRGYFGCRHSLRPCLWLNISSSKCFTQHLGLYVYPASLYI